MMPQNDSGSVLDDLEEGQPPPPTQAAIEPRKPSGASGSILDELETSQPSQQREGQQINWSDIPGQALGNIPGSAMQFATDIVQPIIHPIDTAMAIKNIGHGVLQKLGVAPGTENEQYADAVGKFLSDRYGGVENVKHTMATDPVGFASDLSLILSGGATAAGKIPAIAGRAGEVSRIGELATRPLSGAANLAGNVAAEVIGGMGTHTGPESLRIAHEAGMTGGEAARAFRENLRGAAPMEDAVDEAKQAVTQLRKERGDVYRENMAKLRADTTVLPFDKIDDAMAKITEVSTFHGIPINEKTQAIREEIGQAVGQWRILPANEFHTPEGLDALKKKIGDIRDSTQPDTPARVVANDTYGAIRKTIIDHAPEYAKSMRGYEEASKQIKDIEKTLSLNPNASIDTSLRKLQSTLRDNVNTSYGRRGELVNYLVNAGATNLLYKLAGQSLKPWTPRGLGKLQLGLEAGAALAGGLTAGTAGAGIGALAAAPLMSPRLMGEAAYYSGVARRPFQSLPVGRSLYQTGRFSRPTEEPAFSKGGAAIARALRTAKRIAKGRKS